jgi:hypothetical protein
MIHIFDNAIRWAYDGLRTSAYHIFRAFRVFRGQIRGQISISSGLHDAQYHVTYKSKTHPFCNQRNLL